jgi:SynChlorMet cassette radical SAM/SPASM protein ScmF
METQTSPTPLLTTFLIYPTSRCNLRCRHCYFAPAFQEQPGRHAEEISCEQICKAIDSLLPFGLRACKLSGGEPFLRDDLMDVCRFIDARGIFLIIETNGTLVTEHHADVLAHLEGRCAISVSIDGATAETHETLRGVRGCFQQAWQGIERLVRAGLRVQIIAAAYAGNQSELLPLLALAHDKGVTSFRVCFVNAIGRAKDLPLIRLEEALELDRQLSDHAKALGLPYSNSIPLALERLAYIVNPCVLNGRCNINSTLGILADGTITICGMGRYADEFRFGRLDRDEIAEVWRTHPTLRLIREGIPHRLQGICGACILQKACLGCCRLGRENVTLESFFEPFETCVIAERLGYFPKTRILERRRTPV